MNWDAIGAIAELLGAVGVIASLLYLARQMRSAAVPIRTRIWRAGDGKNFRAGVLVETGTAERSSKAVG